MNNSISISGGNETANINFSVANSTMRDLVPNSKLGRNTFNLRGFLRPWRRLEIDAKINYSLEDVKNRPYLGYSGANVALALLGLPGNIDQAWLEDNRVNERGEYQSWNSQSRIINPYYALYNMENKSKKDRVLGYVSLNYEFTDWLNLRVKSGIDHFNYDYYNYSPVSTPLQESGEMSQLFANTKQINAEFLLTAKKQLNENWNISGNIGGNIMRNETKTTTIVGKGQADKARISINNYSEYMNAFNYPRKQINSLYAFANIGFKDYLYLDLTGRNDWSSTLPATSRSFFYPSAALSFIATEGIKSIKSKTFNYIKLRASYAEVGGDTEPYVLSRTFSNYPYTFNGVTLSSDATTVKPNANLKPSRKKGFETGLDLKLFSWRLGIEGTFYYQNTVDEIIQLPVSSASGKDYAYINAGEINNKGWELSVDAMAIKKRDFTWNIRLNTAQNFNKIVKLAPNAKTQEIARAEWVSSFIQAREGGSYGDIVGYDFLRNENGDILINEKGLPQRSKEQVVLGNGQYKLTGGLAQTFTYKTISLRVLFDFKWGADLLSMSNLKLNQYGSSKRSLEGREGWSKSEVARIAAGKTPQQWTATGGLCAPGVIPDENGGYKPNDIYVNPMDYWHEVANNSILTPYIYDASFIKLREVIITYNFPQKIIQKTKFFKAATVSITGRNLFVWSDVPNIDPESTYSISNGQGYEYGSLPQRATFGFNINLKF